MPVRYTCRLIVVDTPAGGFRVKYGYLGGDARHTPPRRIITIIGPEIVEPPAGEMTWAEIGHWECSLVGNGDTGYKIVSKSSVHHTTPLIEATKTLEDEIPKGSVEWQLRCTRREEVEMLLGVELLSKWHACIPNVSIRCGWKMQEPQPIPGATEVFGVMQSDAGLFCFQRATELDSTSLAPRGPVLFVADREGTAAIRSLSAALAPENLWLSLCTDGYEFDRILGSEAAKIVEQWS